MAGDRRTTPLESVKAASSFIEKCISLLGIFIMGILKCIFFY